MPTYVYECSKCGDELEVWQSFSEDPLKKHPKCGGKLIKVLQPVGIVLKGPGFYKTDSRNGTKSSSTGTDSSTESKSSSTTKSETPSTPKPSTQKKAAATKSDTSASSTST